MAERDPEHAAQIRHVALQRVRGRRRRVLAPHDVDQPVGADGLAGAQAEDGQHGLAAQSG